MESLKNEAKKAESVYFATDPDREGEAIAWHLANILNIDPNKPNRIEFNEITKGAVQKGLEKPRPIDLNLVDAQQARRVLDRLVGYKLSPLLCKKIQKRLSAGRVQSVTLKIVVDREREIENFVSEEYWLLNATLDAKKTKDEEKVKASLYIEKNKKIRNKAQMDEILAAIKGKNFVVGSVKRAESKSRPSAPFTTSTMQQDSLNKLGMSLKLTSATAQTLYEGVNIPGEGKVALVTYIRTDSVRVSPEAQRDAIRYIKEKYGDKYAPDKPNFYKSRKDIQDAHEAIRPISIERTPDSLKKFLPKPQYKLYKLIYDRFLASQMTEALFNTIQVDIICGDYLFKTSGKTPIFDGFSIVYNNLMDENDIQLAKIPNISEGDVLKLIELKPEQKFTKPPARYTEASLVKAMEEKGVGRPATYVPTITVLLSRYYVEKDNKYLVPTQLGKAVVDMLVKYFSNIMEIGFTADMEDKLDDIEEGGKVWQNVISEFWAEFSAELKKANDDSYTNKPEEEDSGVVCEKCGSKMVYKMGRYGRFLACSGFPDCRNTKPASVPVAKCPKCGKDVHRRRSKKGKFFYGCSGYPECDYFSWDIPANEKCPKCNEEMIIKNYVNQKITACPKCDYSRKELKTKVKEFEDKEE